MPQKVGLAAAKVLVTFLLIAHSVVHFAVGKNMHPPGCCHHCRHESALGPICPVKAELQGLHLNEGHTGQGHMFDVYAWDLKEGRGGGHHANAKLCQNE